MDCEVSKMNKFFEFFAFSCSNKDVGLIKMCSIRVCLHKALMQNWKTAKIVSRELLIFICKSWFVKPSLQMRWTNATVNRWLITSKTDSEPPQHEWLRCEPQLRDTVQNWRWMRSREQVIHQNIDEQARRKQEAKKIWCSRTGSQSTPWTTTQDAPKQSWRRWIHGLEQWFEEIETRRQPQRRETWKEELEC